MKHFLNKMTKNKKYDIICKYKRGDNMQTLKLSQKQLDNLEEYSVPAGISNTEAKLYKLKIGIKKYDNQDLLLKKLYITQDRMVEDDKYGLYYTSTVSNKYHTISKLNDYQNILNMDELVIPRHQVDVRGEVVGFTVPEIKNAIPLQIINEQKTTTFEDKINYLKQIGLLLRKIESLNKSDLKFFIHDLHESNIVVDQEKKIHLVDLDSSSFTQEYGLPSKYLCINKNIKNLSKYKYNNFDLPYPSVENDLFCYNIMILNTLYGGEISKLPKEEFYQYLSYLVSIGYSYEFINCLAKIYNDASNVNPVDYLEELTSDKIGKAGKPVYEYCKNKR